MTASLPIIGALGLLVVLWFLDKHNRARLAVFWIRCYMKLTRRVVLAVKPDVTMEEVWRILFQGLREEPDRLLTECSRFFKEMPPDARQSLHDSLLSVEESSLQAEEPLPVIRRAIMEVEFNRQWYEAFLGLSIEDQALLKASDAEEFAVADDDWFTYYQAALRNTVHGWMDCMKGLAQDPDDTVCQLLVSRYADLVEALRKNVVDAPIKSKFDLSKLNRAAAPKSAG